MRRRALLRTLAFVPLATLSAPFCRSALGATESADDNGGLLLRDHPLVGKTWDVASARFVSRDAVVDSLARASAGLLGEVHDNPDHHAIQAELLEAIASRGRKPLVAFEQMDGEHDAALQRRLASGGATPDDIADAVSFDRNGWNWAYYEPLVAVALRYGLPLRASNLSRKAASQIARQGLDSVDPARIAALRIEAAWTPAREQALREIIRDSHCGALPEAAVPAMAAAQRTRDATLAESLLVPARDGAILIAGNGHVRRDMGVPVYLAAAGISSCAVGIVEVQAGTHDPQAYVQGVVSAGALYDYACYTARRDRPDPCAAFRK